MFQDEEDETGKDNQIGKPIVKREDVFKKPYEDDKEWPKPNDALVLYSNLHKLCIIYIKFHFLSII